MGWVMEGVAHPLIFLIQTDPVYLNTFMPRHQVGREAAPSCDRPVPGT